MVRSAWLQVYNQEFLLDEGSQRQLTKFRTEFQSKCHPWIYGIMNFEPFPEVMILRTLDPSELELKLESPSMVVDMESRREIYLDPDAARETYRQQFDEHRIGIAVPCSMVSCRCS